MEHSETLKESFYGYIQNQLSAEQAQEFLIHLDSGKDQELFLELIEQALDSPIAEAVFQKPELQQLLNQSLVELKQRIYAEPVKHKRLWPRIAAVAASILLVAGLGLLFYTSYYAPRHPEGSAATRDLLANNIKPGTNKAILTLANGQQITLNDAANGAIANQSGIKITKTADGQVIYNSSLPSGISPQRGERGVVLNTITTPRGGQYQVHLPDGTHVWLNAASTLKYPITFTGAKDRKVTLTGEAYFEVAKDKAHPFKVTSPTQEVTVLGTHFNINTYPDEPTTKTTLLEGSVQVSILHPSPLRGEVAKPVRGEQLTLKPNQQSTLKSGAFLIKTVDPSDAIAWKNNKFLFDNENIKSIMRKISRWYNVDIEYQGNLDNIAIAGTVSRFGSVTEVLEMLGATKTVQFKIEGNRIIVSPYNK